MNYTTYYIIFILIVLSIIKSYLKKSIINVFTDKEYLLLYVVLNLIAILIYYLLTNHDNMLSNIYNKYINLEQTNHIKLIIISIIPIISYHYMSKLKVLNLDTYKSLL